MNTIKFKKSLLLIISFLVIAQWTSARTLYVSKLGDDTNNGLSKKEAFLTINKAFVHLEDEDTIMIGEGIFTTHVTLEWNKSISIIGSGYNSTVIQSSDEYIRDNKQVFVSSVFDHMKSINCDNFVSHSLISDLTIRNGIAATSEPMPTSVGGAIKNFSNLTIKNCILENNIALNGGAIYNDGSLVLENVILKNNHAFNVNGDVYNSPKAKFQEIDVVRVNNTSDNEIDKQGGINYGTGKGGVLFIDVNGDGHPDLFQYGWYSVNGYPNITKLYINDGSDNFILSNKEHNIPPSANCRFLIGDINNDGKMDLLTSFQQSGSKRGTYVYLNNGDSTFTEICIMDMNIAPYVGSIYGGDDAVQSILCDVNNDGRLDVVTSFVPLLGPAIFTTTILINNGDSTFTEIKDKKNLQGETTLWYGGTWSEIVAADFTGDGNQDILIGCYNKCPEANFGYHTYLMIGDGTGNFDCKEVTNFIPTGDKRIVYGANYMTGDFNGDGNGADLLFAGSSSRSTSRGIHLFIQKNTASSTSLNKESKVSIHTQNSIAKLSNLRIGSFIAVYNTLGVMTDQFTVNETNVDIKLKSDIQIIRIDNQSYKVLNNK
jgi:hypothetical protein